MQLKKEKNIQELKANQTKERMDERLTSEQMFKKKELKALLYSNTVVPN